jgi:pimeloyl-ACP methyl ester carboxylesterase
MALTKSLVGLAGFNLHLSSKEDVDLYIDQVAEMDPGILFHLMENYENYDATSWLHQVRVPTLVVAGENDHIIPREQQELMHQLIPDSQMEVIRHGSHCPQMDLPELVNLKIERFLNEIGYQAPIQTTETASPPTEQRPGLLGSEADAAAPDIIARGTFLRPRG